MGTNATIADVLAGRAAYAVVCGDCRDVLGLIPNDAVDHALSDPPYEAAAHTLGRRVNTTTLADGGRLVEEAALSFAPITDDLRRAVAIEMARIAKRWVAAFCQVEAAMRWSEAFAAGGAPTRRIGVWVKPDAMPQFSGDRPGMGYESIVFAHRKGRSTWNGGGRVGVFTHNKNTPGGAHVHETQKPLPLMLELVELFTDPNELVLDPFAGSGTTGVACLRLGRRVILIERDAKYAEIARERMAAEVAGLSLTAARAGQLGLFAPAEPKRKRKLTPVIDVKEPT